MSLLPFRVRLRAAVAAAAVAAAALAGAAALGACGPQTAPVIDPLRDTTAEVGAELQILVHATAGGAPARIEFNTPDLPDARKRKIPATLTNYADGRAVFRFVPLAADIGQHEIDFRATAPTGETAIASMVVSVVPGVDDAPVFRAPVGEGTTLDLARDACVKSAVLVDDADQAEVKIRLAPPLVAGATLTQTAGHAAALGFCPTAKQIADATVYVLTFVADDGAHQTLKTYTIVLRRPPSNGCTTAAPSIDHMPLGAVTTSGNLRVDATITDDVGVTAVRLYWSTQAPVDPQHPALDTMAPVQLTRASGDARAGAYQAFIPNPVVALPPGASRTVYYLLEARDADPPLGCDHVVTAPIGGVYSFVVTRP